MKIKQKKQLNLLQLIEWAWKNPNLSNGMSFLSIGSEIVKINFRFNPRGVLNLDVLNGNNISNDVLFTFEVEEEIDEDTVIPKLVARHRDTGFTLFENDYINNEFPLDSVQAFYIMNDDLTMTLIWRDGKLVG